MRQAEKRPKRRNAEEIRIKTLLLLADYPEGKVRVLEPTPNTVRTFTIQEKDYEGYLIVEQLQDPEKCPFMPINVKLEGSALGRYLQSKTTIYTNEEYIEGKHRKNNNSLRVTEKVEHVRQGKLYLKQKPKNRLVSGYRLRRTGKAFFQCLELIDSVRPVDEKQPNYLPAYFLTSNYAVSMLKEGKVRGVKDFVALFSKKPILISELLLLISYNAELFTSVCLLAYKNPRLLSRMITHYAEQADYNSTVEFIATKRRIEFATNDFQLALGGNPTNVLKSLKD